MRSYIFHRQPSPQSQSIAPLHTSSPGAFRTIHRRSLSLPCLLLDTTLPPSLRDLELTKAPWPSWRCTKVYGGSDSGYHIPYGQMRVSGNHLHPIRDRGSRDGGMLPGSEAVRRLLQLFVQVPGARLRVSSTRIGLRGTA